MVGIGAIADMNGRIALSNSVEFDPSRHSAINFAVMHNAAFPTTMW
jgi:hypothetical protein